MDWTDHRAVTLIATSAVDVLIPLSGALLLLIQPKCLLKRSDGGDSDPAEVSRLRFFGFVLLAVAGLYYLQIDVPS